MSSECRAQHRRLRASAGLKPPRVQQGGNGAADCQARGRSRRRSHTHCQQRRHRTHGATRCHRTVARPGEQVCLNHIQSSLGWPPQVGWHKLRSRSMLLTLGVTSGAQERESAPRDRLHARLKYAAAAPLTVQRKVRGSAKHSTASAVLLSGARVLRRVREKARCTRRQQAL